MVSHRKRSSVVPKPRRPFHLTMAKHTAASRRYDPDGHLASWDSASPFPCPQGVTGSAGGKGLPDPTVLATHLAGTAPSSRADGPGPLGGSPVSERPLPVTCGTGTPHLYVCLPPIGCQLHEDGNGAARGAPCAMAGRCAVAQVALALAALAGRAPGSPLDWQSPRAPARTAVSDL